MNDINFKEFKNTTQEEQKLYLEYCEAKKNIAESEKSKIEFIEAQKHFTKKPSFYITVVSALIPSILAIWAFYGTNAKDFFNNKVREVELNKRELTIQIAELETVKKELVQDSLDLLAWHEKRKEELDAEYQMKEQDLKKDYDGKIATLEEEVDVKNETIEQKLRELQNNTIKAKDLELELKKSLTASKQKNELIARIQNENKLIENQLDMAESSRNNAERNAQMAYMDVKKLKAAKEKNTIVIYMLSKNWVRMGFNRVRAVVDSDLRNKDIERIITQNSAIFEKINLTDSNDPLGIQIKSSATPVQLMQ